MEGRATAREAGRSVERAARFDKLFQVPIFVAALLVIPVIVIEQAHVSHAVKTSGTAQDHRITATC